MELKVRLAVVVDLVIGNQSRNGHKREVVGGPIDGVPSSHEVTHCKTACDVAYAPCDRSKSRASWACKIRRKLRQVSRVDDRPLRADLPPGNAHQRRRTHDPANRARARHLDLDRLPTEVHGLRRRRSHVRADHRYVAHTKLGDRWSSDGLRFDLFRISHAAR